MAFHIMQKYFQKREGLPHDENYLHKKTLLHKKKKVLDHKEKQRQAYMRNSLGQSDHRFSTKFNNFFQTPIEHYV